MRNKKEKDPNVDLIKVNTKFFYKKGKTRPGHHSKGVPNKNLQK